MRIGSLYRAMKRRGRIGKPGPRAWARMFAWPSWGRKAKVEHYPLTSPPPPRPGSLAAWKVSAPQVSAREVGTEYDPATGTTYSARPPSPRPPHPVQTRATATSVDALTSLGNLSTSLFGLIVSALVCAFVLAILYLFGSVLLR